MENGRLNDVCMCVHACVMEDSLLALLIKLSADEM